MLIFFSRLTPLNGKSRLPPPFCLRSAIGFEPWLPPCIFPFVTTSTRAFPSVRDGTVVSIRFPSLLNENKSCFFRAGVCFTVPFTFPVSTDRWGVIDFGLFRPSVPAFQAAIFFSCPVKPSRFSFKSTISTFPLRCLRRGSPLFFSPPLVSTFF